MYTFSNGLSIGEIGYGLMGLTWRPQPPSEEQAFKAMRKSLEQGSNFWNGGEIYGTPERNSLTLLNKYFTAYPEDAEKVVLSIKGGMKHNGTSLVPDGSAAGVRTSVENCIRLLDGKKKIDFFECARVDPTIPIEETVQALAELIKEGKIGGYMLSEVNAGTIRRAHKVHPASGVELEVSLWSTEPLTNGAAEACAELGIPLIAYSPIGRGMLTGEIKSPEDLPEGDMRRHLPRFQPGVFEVNLKLVTEVQKMAAKKNSTAAQLAVAWVLARSKKVPGLTIIPIPGSTTEARVTENAKSKDISWTDEDEKELSDILSKFEVVGSRYPEAAAKYLSL